MAPARAARSRHAGLEAAHLAEQQQAGGDVHDAQHHQGGAPADQLAQQPARRLAEDDAQDLPRDIAREHRLAPLVGDDVADPGDRHGNDGGGSGPGQEAHHHQRPERRHAGRDHGGNAGPEGAQHDHVEPAARVAERPDHHLEYAVRQRKSRHRQGRRADRDAELAGDLRQQRIAHAQVRGAGERGQRQQGDGARRRLARLRASRSALQRHRPSAMARGQIAVCRGRTHACTTAMLVLPPTPGILCGQKGRATCRCGPRRRGRGGRGRDGSGRGD